MILEELLTSAKGN